MKLRMAVVCFIIHGIGEQDQKFSLPLREGVHKQLQKLQDAKGAPVQVEFYDLYWANEGSDFQDNLYRSIYPELYSPAGLLKRGWQMIRNVGPVRALTFRLIGDVFGYLGRFQKPIKKSVVRQIARVLREKQEAQEPFSIILVGHSLGSVILHDLISGFLQYRYAAFETLVGSTSVFTMGSPLSLFSLVADSANPKRFRKWTNFLHPQDPIAFPMASRFPDVQDVLIDEAAANPLKTHALYWTHPEVHKRIAAEIHDHAQNKLEKVIPPEDMPAVPPEIYQPFHSSGVKSGFSHYLPNFDKVPFEELFGSAKRIDACLMYGATWTSKYAQYISRALENPKKQMRFCLLSPESPFVPGVAHQYGFSDADLRQRILKSTQTLKEAFETAARKTSTPGRIQIYHSINGISHGFYRFDDMVYFAPRHITSDKLASTPIPTMAFRGGSLSRRTGGTGDFYAWLLKDFELLLAAPKEAVLVFDSDKKIEA